MADVSYPAPVSRLLALGERPEVPQGYYASLCLSAVDRDELVRMVLDPKLNYDRSCGPEVWAPMHAMRALAEFKVADAVEPLTRYWNAYPDFDRFCDCLIDAFVEIGPATINSLGRVVLDPFCPPTVRNRACETIGEIGKRYPESRPQCVGFLATGLERYAEQDDVLNAFLTSALVDVQAVEAAPLIEAAFCAGTVDEGFVGTWEDIQYDLGLLERPPERRVRAPSYRSLIFDNGYHPDMSADEKAMLRRAREKRAKAAKKMKQKEKQEKRQRKLNRKH